MIDYFNDIQIYIDKLFNGENIIFTIFIGIIIILLLNEYFKEKMIVSDDIKQCMNKYDMNKIYEIPNLLTSDECDKIINLSRDKVKRSMVIGENGNDVSNIRTSKNTFLSSSLDPLIKKIDDRIEEIIGISSKKYEDLQVVYYQPGQFYKAHWDACDPNKDPRCVDDHKKGGLRFATFIIYLNDDMEGGKQNFLYWVRK